MSATFQTLFSPLTVFIWLAAIIFATIASPFGTFVIMEWPIRAVFWLVVVSVSIVIGYGMRAVSLVLVGTDRPVLLDIAMIALTTFVITPTVWLFTRMARLTPAVDLPPLAAFAGYVMLCTVVIVVGRRVAPGFETYHYEFLPEPEPVQTITHTNTQPPRILRRLRPDSRGDILRLSANDHFVEVATLHGVELLRMRLADAIAEMEPVEGYCVHRSHWVAKAAIVSVERENTHKLFVVLANKDRLPVSRKYRANLEKAGLV